MLVRRVACCLVLVGLPAASLASGPFSAEFLEKDFALEYVNHGHRIFRNQEQASRYHDQHLAAFHADLTARLPVIRQAIQRAGLPLAPLDLTLPIAGADAPGNRELKVPTKRGSFGGHYTLTLTLRKAPDSGRLERLIRELTRIFDRPGGDSGTASPPALVRPGAHRLVGGKVAVYVACRVKALPTVAKSFEPQVKAMLDRVTAAVAKRLKQPAWLKGLGGKLINLRRAIAANHRRLDAALFNFHGPLIDLEHPPLLRTSHDVGLLRVVVMVAIKRYNWGTVNLHLSATLKQVCAPGK